MADCWPSNYCNHINSSLLKKEIEVTLKNVSWHGGLNLKPSSTPGLRFRKDPVASLRVTHSIGTMAHLRAMKAFSPTTFTKAVLRPGTDQFGVILWSTWSHLLLSENTHQLGSGFQKPWHWFCWKWRLSLQAHGTWHHLLQWYDLCSPAKHGQELQEGPKPSWSCPLSQWIPIYNLQLHRKHDIISLLLG